MATRKNFLNNSSGYFHMDKVGRPYKPAVPPSPPIGYDRDWLQNYAYKEIISNTIFYYNPITKQCERKEIIPVYASENTNGNPYDFEVPMGFLTYHKAEMRNSYNQNYPTIDPTYVDLNSDCGNKLDMRDIRSTQLPRLSRSSLLGPRFSSIIDIPPNMNYMLPYPYDNLMAILFIYPEGSTLKVDIGFTLWNVDWDYVNDRLNYLTYMRVYIAMLTIDVLSKIGAELNIKNYVSLYDCRLDPLRANGFDTIEFLYSFVGGNFEFAVKANICLGSPLNKHLRDGYINIIPIPILYGIGNAGASKMVYVFKDDYPIRTYRSPFISKNWGEIPGKPGQPEVPELIY